MASRGRGGHSWAGQRVRGRGGAGRGGARRQPRAGPSGYEKKLPLRPRRGRGRVRRGGAGRGGAGLETNLARRGLGAGRCCSCSCGRGSVHPAHPVPGTKAPGGWASEFGRATSGRRSLSPVSSLGSGVGLGSPAPRISAAAAAWAAYGTRAGWQRGWSWAPAPATASTG